MAMWTMAKSRIDDGPGRGGTEAATACPAMMFQSDTTSVAALAVTGPISSVHTVAAASFWNGLMSLASWLTSRDLRFGIGPVVGRPQVSISRQERTVCRQPRKAKRSWGFHRIFPGLAGGGASRLP